MSQARINLIFVGALFLLLPVVGWLTLSDGAVLGDAQASSETRAKLASEGKKLLIGSGKRRPALPIKLQTATFGDGSIFDLSKEQGNVVVLYFMAAWCTTCIPEAKALAKIHADYADRGVRVLVLDVEQRETERHLAAFRGKAGNGEHLWALDREFQVARPYNVRALDTTIIIYKNGRVAYRDMTPTHYDRLASVVEALLQ